MALTEPAGAMADGFGILSLRDHRYPSPLFRLVVRGEPARAGLLLMHDVGNTGNAP